MSVGAWLLGLAWGAPALHPAWTATVLPFPEDGPGSDGLAVCAPGLAVVPTRGGVALAGLGTWLYAPTDVPSPVNRVACADGAALWLAAADGALFRVRRDLREPWERAGTLPGGSVGLEALPDGSVWTAVRTPTGFEILRSRDGATFEVRWRGTGALAAFAPVTVDAAVVVVSGRLLVLHTGEAPTVALELDNPVIDVAVGSTGEVWVSTRGGVVRVGEGAPDLVLSGETGALVARGEAVYVRCAEPAVVLRLVRAGRE